jgi:hypothetical protein
MDGTELTTEFNPDNLEGIRSGSSLIDFPSETSDVIIEQVGSRNKVSNLKTVRILLVAVESSHEVG